MNQIKTTSSSGATRWWQLFFGVVAMMAISSPQYVWALFTSELTKGLGATLPQVQVTFAILIVAQTFLSPFQGYLIDKFGPRMLLSCGAILTALSWILASGVTGIWGLYLTYGLLGGVGTGIIYVGVIGLMVQWFPDRRGFAVGMVAAGYGFGAIMTTFAISMSIKSSGVASTLVMFGVIIGVVGLAAAQGMRRPRADEVAEHIKKVKLENTTRESSYSYKPTEMLKKPVFWLLFVMMTMMSTSGLMVISQMGAFAKDFGVADAMVFGMAALPLALTIDRICNGLTRPFFGWVSDRIGRENTMFIAFGLEGVAMTLWLMTTDNPVLFVILSGVVFFGWGEIFSLFPSILTDTFGTKHATTNYGFLYMAQGVGSVLGGPLAALMHDATGSWTPVFATVICMDFATAILAYIVLKPMRKKFLAQSEELATSSAVLTPAYK
ncbi:Putative transporter of the major facilitator superfamily [Herminiimonas arsenicoxydans]|uniref:Transporter of the major facilitator superfamily n=1 Tax=Herminiimonas arsenicoxydans TaxID=204773 RepID=A4G7V2_HERAR|nr:Putative transporter of the major facilitator superfamily [Herminiimonas arsenicoxydans]